MSERKLSILYGSQTGTAQEVAERLWRDSKRFHWSGFVKSMDEFFPPDLPTEKMVIFVCSTTGQGDEPDNMLQFWKFLLRRSLPTNSLSNTNIAVLGLGDSSYTKFNFAAKRLHKRLLQLGATSVVELGLADDQHDLGADAVIEPWVKILWEKLLQLYPLPANLKPVDESNLSPPRYLIKLVPQRSTSTALFNGNESTLGTEGPNKARLISNTRTTRPDHFQDVRLLKMHVPDLKYKPGDVLMVQPSNLEENVTKFLQLLNLETNDDIIEIQQCSENDSIALPPSWLIPKPCTIRDCAKYLLDLQAVPQRYSLQILAHFTTSELEREKLLEFCSPEGQQDLFNYCHRPRRGIVEVLEDFPHATAALPITYLFDVFRPIRPRAFSIASASEAQIDHLELLVAVVHYKTRIQAPRLGLCSTWLSRLQTGDQISVWQRPGSFRFPSSPDVPLIMVGPGTGCAPFRSLIQQRAALYPDVKGKLTLFFGCRKENGDFHCSEEWHSYVDRGLLTLFCAFSQDQPHKIYVQHKIAEEGKLIWDLLQNKNAYFFVAGNAKNMPTSVREAVTEVVEKEGEMSQGEAKQFVQKLENAGRYQTETWS